jgi:hypothetical protein
MPVICPTCQMFCLTVILSSTLISIRNDQTLIKPLNRRRRFSRDNRGGRLGNRQRGCAGGLCSSARLRDTTRMRTGSRMPNSPGTRDRRPGGISDERARHRAHRSQNYRAGHRAQGSTAGTLLGFCLQRNKQPADHSRNKQFTHHTLVATPQRQGTPKMRRQEGTTTAAVAPIARQ